MWAKRTQRIANVVGFLLITVGIVYAIVMLWFQLQRPPALEGFQAGCLKDTTTFPGSPLYLCPTQALAQTMLSYTDSYDRSTIICYTTPKLEKESRYVCYNRPPPLELNTDTGVLEPIFAAGGDDPVPFELPEVLQTTCDSYGSIYAAVVKNLSNVAELRATADWGAKTIQDTKVALETIRDANCSPARSTKWTTICGLLSNAVASFDAYSKDSNLVQAQTTAREVMDSISSLLTTDIEPAFRGSGCPTPAV